MFNSKNFIVFYLNDSGLTCFKFKLNKNKLEFVDTIENYEGESLFLSKNFLIINSADVITKKIESTTVDHSFEEAFPAFNKSDLYFDFQEGEFNKLSIIKKDAFEQLDQKLDFSNLMLVKLRLGSVVNTFNQNELNPKELSEYTIASYLKNINSSNNLIEKHKTLLNTRFNKRFFEFVKWGAIAFFLIGLLINFHFHEKYRKELEEAKTLSQSYMDIDDKLEKLSMSVNTNKQLVNSNNKNDINQLRILNELIIMGGQNIKLDLFSYQPLKNKLNNGKEIRLNKNRIKASGRAASRVALDNYVSELKNSKHINELIILNINQESQKVDFELSIELKDAK